MNEETNYESRKYYLDWENLENCCDRIPMYYNATKQCIQKIILGISATSWELISTKWHWRRNTCWLMTAQIQVMSMVWLWKRKKCYWIILTTTFPLNIRWYSYHYLGWGQSSLVPHSQEGWIHCAEMRRTHQACSALWRKGCRDTATVSGLSRDKKVFV